MRQSIVCVLLLFVTFNQMSWKCLGAETFKIDLIDSRLYHLAVDENGYTIWLINFDKSRIKLTDANLLFSIII